MPVEIRVLHVDDQPVVLSLFENFLEGEDDRIMLETASSGHEALELLSDHEFDCIVSDYDMPGMDGIELLEIVRQEYPDLPFILFTGKGTEEVASEAIRKGVTEYLQKDGLERYELLTNRITNVVSEYHASRELAETSQRLALALAEADAGLWEWDVETNDLYWSEELLNVLEYSRDEFTGTIEFLIEKLHPDDAERTEESIETALQTGEPYRVEQRVETATGEYRWLDVRGQIIDDQAGRRMIGVGFDITERKEQERKRQQMINRVTDAIVEIDDDWRFVLANDQAEQVVHVEKESLLGRNFWDIFSGADDTRFEDKFRQIMDTREPTSLTEFSAGLDGWYEVDVYPRDEGGLEFYFHDVTDRVHRSRELERLNERLDQFANGLNHELRAPLTVAEDRLELVAEECESDHLDHVFHALDRMEDLIDDLLRLSR